MYIVANFKSFLLPQQELVLIQQIATLNYDDLIICPSFVTLQAARKQNSALKLCAQNCSAYEPGAHTGDITTESLGALSINYVLIGHAEHHDSTATKVAKLRRAIATGILPIVCIGQKHAGNLEQLEYELIELRPYLGTHALIAYEPLYAVNAPQAASLQEIAQGITCIKKHAESFPILYGGSVQPQNVQEITQLPGVAGILLGRSSTDFQTLQKIVSLSLV